MKLQLRANNFPLRLVLGVLAATALTSLAVILNLSISNVWIEQGLNADAGGTGANSMRPHEIFLFGLSALITGLVPAFTVTGIATEIRLRRNPAELPPSFLMIWQGIRSGKGFQLPLFATLAAASMWLLIFGPGVVGLIIYVTTGS